MIQTYLRPDADGNNVLIDDPRAFFFEDEIEKLGALGVDTGSTLFGEIRIFPAGEQVLQIPFALPVTHEHK